MPASMRMVAGGLVCDGSPPHTGTLLTTGGTTFQLYMVGRRHTHESRRFGHHRQIGILPHLVARTCVGSPAGRIASPPASHSRGMTQGGQPRARSTSTDSPRAGRTPRRARPRVPPPPCRRRPRRDCGARLQVHVARPVRLPLGWEVVVDRLRALGDLVRRRSPLSLCGGKQEQSAVATRPRWGKGGDGSGDGARWQWRWGSARAGTSRVARGR